MLEIMFFYILSTVFDVCPIYLEEYWNNTGDVCML